MTWTWWRSWSNGVHFGEHTCVVALGIGIDGTKHPLAVEEGSTENATLATGLITGLRDRGLDVTRPILAVLDGSAALARAVRDVFDKPLIQRCQEHKIRNVRDKLPGLFSELPDVAAAQKPKRLRRRATALTGMSLSVGRDGCDLDPGATESGHSCQRLA